MPPVNQGSKAGLITTLIISIVLLLVCVIMLFYTNTEMTKLTKDHKDLKSKYEKVARNDEMTAEGSPVSQIDAAKDKLGLTSGATTIEIALAQINRLAKVIGPSANFSDAESTAALAAARAQQILKNPAVTTSGPTTAPAGSDVTMPAGETLVGLVGKLGAALNESAKTNGKQAQDLAALKGDLETRVKAWNDQYTELNNKYAEAEKKVAEAQKAMADAQAQYTTKQAGADASNQQTVELTSKQVQDAVTELAKVKAELADAKKTIVAITNKIGRTDVRDAAVRQADGTIIRVPSSSVCYISLGLGDHLPVGTTFEVYDKVEGIPKLGTDALSNNALPTGKGSIEVVRVGQNSSECRIVHLQSGMTLSEGDLIANLVYDRNNTYNFFVYGNFDVDGNNLWTAAEGDVVKSLVTRWGGKLGSKINIDTDFVVLGQEPVVPAFTKEELDDPINKQKFDTAVAALKTFNDLVSQAAELHIPVMNQNRFMYFIGYFDQMKR